MKKQSRRKFISTIGVIFSSSIAGCSALKPPKAEDNEVESINLNTEPSEDAVVVGVEYPSGFSGEGIEDFSEALGTNSSYYDVNSIFIEEYLYTQKGSERTSETKTVTQASGQNKVRTQYVQKDGQIINQSFQKEDTVYIRSNGEETETETVEYSRKDLYLIPKIKRYLSSVNLSIDSIQGSNLVYSASKEDISSGSVIFEELESNPESVEVNLVVRSDGVPVNLEIETISSDKGKKITTGLNMEFSAYNVLTVNTPGWVKQIEENSGDK